MRVRFALGFDRLVSCLTCLVHVSIYDEIVLLGSGIGFEGELCLFIGGFYWFKRLLNIQPFFFLFAALADISIYVYIYILYIHVSLRN